MQFVYDLQWHTKGIIRDPFTVQQKPRRNSSTNKRHSLLGALAIAFGELGLGEFKNDLLMRSYEAPWGKAQILLLPKRTQIRKG